MERRGLAFGSWAYRLSLAFSLPTALPLMNGYSSYEQHHSGKAGPQLGCRLWPSDASLGLGLMCVVTEGDCALPLQGGFALGVLHPPEYPQALHAE